MGLDSNGTRFLLQQRALGVDPKSTAMIGRQHLLVDEEELAQNLRELGYEFEGADVKRVIEGSGGFAEGFLEALGAESVDSFDNSGFEGATKIHDMNLQIPGEYRGKYTLVLDGGSLEHVFNFPLALKNCLEMVAPGGHFLSISPANNLFGHGFYQISPELFFSVLNEANGFELTGMYAFEDSPGSGWYRVRDPKEAGHRVILINQRPVYLLISAKRTGDAEPLSVFPQQSDYAATWEANGGGDSHSRAIAAATGSGDRRPRLRFLPYGLKRFLKKLATGIDPECPGFLPGGFEEFDPARGLPETGRVFGITR